MKTLVFSIVLIVFSQILFSQKSNSYEIDFDNCQITELKITEITSSEKALFVSNMINNVEKVHFCITNEEGKVFIIAEKDLDLSLVFQVILNYGFNIVDEFQYNYNAVDLFEVYPKYSVDNEYSMPDGYPKFYKIGQKQSYPKVYEEVKAVWISRNPEKYNEMKVPKPTEEDLYNKYQKEQELK